MNPLKMFLQCIQTNEYFLLLRKKLDGLVVKLLQKCPSAKLTALNKKKRVPRT